MAEQTNWRIESEAEVKAYLQNMKYALEHGAKIDFRIKRLVDEKRGERFTNAYTVAELFPNESPAQALRKELKKLTCGEYIRTVKDLRFPERGEMREFGKAYKGKGDVYIKIRVEVLGKYGIPTTFVMSFHFAEKAFSEEMFPYRNK